MESTSDSERLKLRTPRQCSHRCSSELEDAQTRKRVTEAQPDSRPPLTLQRTLSKPYRNSRRHRNRQRHFGIGRCRPGEDAAEEEEGEYQTDDDCLLLTAKECCPSLGVCPGLPRGTLAEEVEALMDSNRMPSVSLAHPWKSPPASPVLSSRQCHPFATWSWVNALPRSRPYARSFARRKVPTPNAPFCLQGAPTWRS